MNDFTDEDRRQLIMTLCPDCETGNICPRHTNHKEGLHQTIPPTWNDIEQGDHNE